VLDTPTWRANPDWVALLEDLRPEAGGVPEMIISGCIGLRGDGYRVDSRMTKSWTREIQWHSPATTASCRGDRRTSPSSVGVAAPTIGTSPRSVRR